MKLIYSLLLVILIAPTVLSQNFKYGKVSKEELSEKVHPKDPQANAAILYREMKSSFEYNQDDGFFLITEILERVKIYNAEGFDWATKEVFLYEASGRSKEEISGLKGYTYYLGDTGKIEDVKLKSDGIFEEERSKYITVTKFTMPALKDGCVIEYKYKIKSPYVGNIDTFKFQEKIPVNKVSFRFETPEYFNYNPHQRGWIPYQVATTHKERTINYRYTRSALETGTSVGNTVNSQLKFRENIYTVDLNDVPAIKEEAYAGNLNNFASALKYELAYTKFPQSPLEMYSTDWGAVSKKIYQSDSFGDQLDRDNYFVNDLDPILAKAQDNNQKMVLIFEFVKAKMNWNKYIGMFADEGVKSAYKKGTGNTADINLMLTAMFRYAGLKANPVLVSTKAHGIPVFPTRNGFNYVISAVETSNGIVLFDASEKNAEPNMLDEEIMNWQGRIVREDGTSDWVSLVPSKHSMEAYMVNSSLALDGTLTGSVKGQYSGNKALNYRDRLRGLNSSDMGIKLEKSLGSVGLTEANLENADNPYEPLKLDFNFETEDFVEDIDGNLYFSPLLFLSQDENPYKLEERLYPMDYGYPQKDKYIVTIDLPEGYKVESLPENVNAVMGNDLFGFKYLLSESGSKIQVMAEFSINTSIVGADNYQDVKKFYQFVIDKEKEKIVLSKI